VILRWAEKSGFDPEWLWSGGGDSPPDGNIAPVTLWYPVGWVA